MQARLPGAANVADAARIRSAGSLAAAEPAAVAAFCRTARAAARDAALAQRIRQAFAACLARGERVTGIGRAGTSELGRALPHAGRVLLLRELARGRPTGARGALLRLLDDAVVGPAGIDDVRRAPDAEKRRDREQAKGSQSHRTRVLLAGSPARKVAASPARFRICGDASRNPIHAHRKLHSPLKRVLGVVRKARYRATAPGIPLNDGRTSLHEGATLLLCLGRLSRQLSLRV